MAEAEKPLDERELLLLAAEIKKGIATLDLHGQTTEEAEASLDYFINHEFMAGNRFVKIIHGKGTGKLQQVVREHLSSHPLVEASKASSQIGEENAVIYAVLAEKE